MLEFLTKREVIENPVTVREYAPEVQVIHNEFNSASDKLVDLANGILSKAATDKGKRLHALGFTAIPEAAEIEKNLKTLGEVMPAAKLTTSYAAKYPNNKFITVSQAKEIATKYGLVIGAASKYCGQIPEDNLRDIEQFRVDEQDAMYQWTEAFWDENLARARSYKDSKFSVKTGTAKQMGFHICAPQTDFVRSPRQRVVDGMLVYDPIVLKPVVGGYLIVTAWGPEAEDPLVKQ
jgi:hypothetical protein